MVLTEETVQQLLICLMVYGLFLNVQLQIILYVKENQVCKRQEYLLLTLSKTIMYFSGECPDGWRVYKDKCYLFNSQRELQTSWFDANYTCTKYRARLLNIKEYVIKYINIFIISIFFFLKYFCTKIY
jgi:hypothetical protein